MLPSGKVATFSILLGGAGSRWERRVTIASFRSPVCVFVRICVFRDASVGTLGLLSVFVLHGEIEVLLLQPVCQNKGFFMLS